MKKILFISEFDLNAQSSGCLHFLDIYTNAKPFADCTFLKISNIYLHTNAFKDSEKGLYLDMTTSDAEEIRANLMHLLLLFTFFSSFCTVNVM